METKVEKPEEKEEKSEVQVGEFKDEAQVGEVKDEAQVGEVKDKAQVGEVKDEAQVETKVIDSKETSNLLEKIAFLEKELFDKNDEVSLLKADLESFKVQMRKM